VKIDYIFCNEHIKISQPDHIFKYSLDSLVLASFVKINKSNQKVLEIGAGSGAISLILADRNKNIFIDAVEIQESVFEILKENIVINKFENKIKAINKNINEVKNICQTDTYDIIVSNPPYFFEREKPVEKELLIARHGDSLTLENIMSVSRKLLKNKGKLFISYPPTETSGVIIEAKKQNLEVKRIKYFFSFNKKSNVALFEISKQAKSGVIIEMPIITNDFNGNYTDELKKYIKGR